MSKQNDQPWDKRPLTARDFAITAGVAVMAIVIGAGLLFAFLREQSESIDDTPTSVAAQPTAQAIALDTAGAERGRGIYQDKCASCHTIGSGATVGPDLKGVLALRDRDWLLEWIQVPDEMLDRGDPLATQLLAEWNNIRMPNLSITSDEAADILAFIELESGGAVEPQTTDEPVLISIEGSAQVGENLFVGATQLQNGGPACIACHGLADVGIFGGGTLGPDLTNVSGRFGEAGLTAALQGLPFPSMAGIFSDHPLTEEEVAHLGALFIETDSEASIAMDYKFAAVGLGGLVVLILLSQLIWNKRLRGVRKPLVGR
jgi:cytochrome c2